MKNRTVSMALAALFISGLTHAEPTTLPAPLIMDGRFSGFDAQAFIRRNHPDFAGQAEAISHWAAYYSVSPVFLTNVLEEKGSPGAMDSRSISVVAANLNAAIRNLTIESDRGRPDHPDLAAALEEALGARPGEISNSILRTRIESQKLGFEVANIAVDEVPPVMDLPFEAPQAWQFNGAHTWTGDDDGSPMSSLDFASAFSQRWNDDTSEDWVAAAHDGQVSVFSSCFVQVQHPNGWATRYYHLDNLTVTNGEQVQAGNRIGNYANTEDQALCSGGHSAGPHVHFALLKDGQYHSLADTPLSGYRVHPGTSSYDRNHARMWLEKRDQKFFAFGEAIATQPGDNVIDYRYNGMWYAPESNGHGLNIEISEYPQEGENRKSVFIALYTYDDGELANFYVGNVDYDRWRTDESQIIPVIQTAGGDFSNLSPIDFNDPGDVMPAGQLELFFADCENAQADMDLVERSSGQLTSHSIELIKVIGVPDHVCESASIDLPD